MTLRDLFEGIKCAVTAGSSSPRSVDFSDHTSRTSRPKKYPPLPRLEVGGISADSRKIKPGWYFLAIKGSEQNGHRFIPEALNKGASGLIVDKRYRLPKIKQHPHLISVRVGDTRLVWSLLAHRWFDEPSHKIKLIGVTGTNGKTTTTHLISKLMTVLGETGWMGTVSCGYGEKTFPSNMTTPDPWEFNRMLHDMCVAGIRYCAAEISSHALDQSRVGGITFHRAIFTNLSQDHLDYHRNMENYFKAKRKLFVERPAAKEPVINSDDMYGLRLVRELKKKVVTYGMNKSAGYRAKNITTRVDGTRFMFCTPEFREEVFLPLPGLHNVYNFLAASAVALEEGVSRRQLVGLIPELRPVPGRLDPIDEGQPFRIFIDYAHTPDGMEKVLGFLCEVKAGRLVVVFGCGGDRDRKKRPLMGHIAEQLADVVFVTSDNPRSEAPLEIMKEIRMGSKHLKEDQWIEIVDRREAIRQAIGMAQAGDIVAILGKGHECVQIIGDRQIPFSDHDVVRDVLRKEHHVLHK